MKNKCFIIGLLLFFVAESPVLAQTFKYSYNGVIITYEITSVPKHEAMVRYVPEDVTEVTVPAVVHFNGESFRVTKIGGGGSRSGGLFGSYEGEGYYSFHNCKLLKTVVLPNTIKEIESWAFADCTWLRSINLPSGLEIIGIKAFYGCQSLTSIILPSSLKRIGCNAFDGCINLNLASIKIPASIKTLEGTGYGGTLFSGKGTLYIPATIDTIEYSALAGCDFRLSEQLGVRIDETIVINVNNTAAYWVRGGQKEIRREAFGSRYKVIGLDVFKSEVVSYPEFYLRKTSGEPAASYVKKILMDAGEYDKVLEFYPNDLEVQKLQRNAVKNSAIVEKSRGNYTEAKRLFEQALTLSPDDESIKDLLVETNNIIAEQERLRKEAEEQARRAEEERQVRVDVDNYVRMAQNQIAERHLRKSIESLEKAIKITQTHNYDYRYAEMSRRIDSIQEILEFISDGSRVLNYKDFCPDLYQSTQKVLEMEIRTSLWEMNKTIESNHVSFSLYTNNQSGAFQLKESSRTLKKICEEILENVSLQPLVIDDKQLNACATYDYDVEYTRGTVKMYVENNEMLVIPEYNLSSNLESDLRRTFLSKQGMMPSSFDGNCKFNVTSMNGGGQMLHDIQLKSVHCKNGPQNAWRSLFVPGWGDKYVKEDGKFNWWKTVVSYGFVGLGVCYLTSVLKYEIKTSEWVYDATALGYREVTRINDHSTDIGTVCTVIGASVWLVDLMYVFAKGNRNKDEAMNHLGRLFVAYNPTYDAPELCYSLSF